MNPGTEPENQTREPRWTRGGPEVDLRTEVDPRRTPTDPWGFFYKNRKIGQSVVQSTGTEPRIQPGYSLFDHISPNQFKVDSHIYYSHNFEFGFQVFLSCLYECWQNV